MNTNHRAAQQEAHSPLTLSQRFQTLTSDQIDEAVLEADKAWRNEGKRKAYSRHLANALVARLPGQPWISVDERLPKSTPGSDEVLFFSPDMRNPTDQAIGVLRYGRWMSGGTEFVNVTHWKPRDQPPLHQDPEASAIRRIEVNRLTPSELQTIERGAELLEGYAAFITSEVMSTDIERHPYVPEIETMAESLRALLAAEPKLINLTEQDALLLNQAHEILLEHAEDQRHKGNDSQAMGADCSADAVLRLSAQALARPASRPEFPVCAKPAGLFTKPLFAETLRSKLDGFAMVPVEPTPEMLRAAVNAVAISTQMLEEGDHITLTWDEAKAVFTAMVAATVKGGA